jgi:CubicO group peptidase (beta-lactamase class C family)
MVMKRFLLPFILLFSTVAFGQDTLVLKLDSLMRTAFARGVFNGNVLVANKGNVIYERSFGFADASKKMLLKPNHRFDVGSISKEFNGVAIMLLQERGRLSLADSLAKFFPELPAWAAKVKVQHLINYTSGIPVPGLPDGTNDQLIFDSLRELKELKAVPGSIYNYSFVDVSLQRRLIEKLAGMPYAAFIKKNLLIPAGMAESEIDYPIDAPFMARAFDGMGKATPYLAGTKGWLRLPARDLYRWTQALHGGLLLKPQSLKALSENFPGGESSLGTVVYEGNSMIWHQHQGSNYNYEAAFYSHLADGITIVLMTNNQQMKVWPLKTAILDILYHRPFNIPKKSLYLGLRERMLLNVEDGLNFYHQLRAKEQQVYDFSFEIGDLISTAKYLQRRNKHHDAIRVLGEAVKLNAKPVDLSYGHELMGMSYQSLNDKPNALKQYHQAIAIYPANKNAANMIQQLNKQ